ncbi:hypothetical protein VT84_30735 [Gemmata sp. SH-PL17]|uniref:hypothetical protein n=1 Tax=Gemmata sp. SH-PL17 TaxID=1630693 RepID=UPI00078BCD96|nr:hypothetical protein [Gemmata sp. SH-PL17]AMV28810.1 hypothetical protein VT84_30735 [Gemmata sp. SH-PL17]
MANAIKYVDNVLGSNGNTGDNPGSGSTGAYADLDTALAAITGGGNRIWVRNTGTDYAKASAVTFPASLKGDTTDGKNVIEGYATTPGARDGRPTFSCSQSGGNVFALNDNDFFEFTHLRFTQTHATKGGAFSLATSASSPLVCRDVVVDGCLAPINANIASVFWTWENCEVLNCTTTASLFPGSNGGFIKLFGCDVHDCPSSELSRGGSFGIGYQVEVVKSIIDGLAAGINGNTGGATPITWVSRDSIWVDITGSAVKTSTTTGTISLEIENSIFYAIGYGIENTALTQNIVMSQVRVLRNNAYGSYTSGAYTGMGAGFGDFALTADPFVNRAARDFTLNNTAGGGALLRGKGFPTAFPSGLTNNRDVGALQHADSGGGTVGGPPRVLQPNTWSLVG